MTTIGEVVSRIRNSIKEVSDDSVFSNRYLWNVYETALKQLIKQESHSGNIYTQSDVWVPICIEMEPVDSIYCNCFCLPNNVTVYRSTRKLPRFLESNDGIVYRWLATPDLSRTFVIVSPAQYQWRAKFKYKRESYAFIHDGYLYTPDKEFPLLSLAAFFTEDISSFVCGSTQKNTTEETKYSSDQGSTTDCATRLSAKVQIPDYLERAAIELVRAEVLPATQLKQDEHPNANTTQRDLSI